MKKSNRLIGATVLLLSALPLWWVADPAQGTEAFGGADAKAQQLIHTIAPDYQAWFTPLLEPASGEIASLLFALQAALGAGVIGYWLGASITREKLRQAQPDAPSTQAAGRVD